MLSGCARRSNEYFTFSYYHKGVRNMVQNNSEIYEGTIAANMTRIHIGDSKEICALQPCFLSEICLRSFNSVANSGHVDTNSLGSVFLTTSLYRILISCGNIYTVDKKSNLST